jgi:hypothetical protein
MNVQARKRHRDVEVEEVFDEEEDEEDGTVALALVPRPISDLSPSYWH